MSSSTLPMQAGSGSALALHLLGDDSVLASCTGGELVVYAAAGWRLRHSAASPLLPPPPRASAPAAAAAAASAACGARITAAATAVLPGAVRAAILAASDAGALALHAYDGASGFSTVATFQHAAADAGAAAVSALALCAARELAALGDERGVCAVRPLARPDAPPSWTGAVGGSCNGPRISDVRFWPGSGHTLLAACDDSVLVCDTRSALPSAAAQRVLALGALPQRAAAAFDVRSSCIAVSPPRALPPTRALALAFPSAADDPWLVCVATAGGSVFSADLRRPGAPLATLRGVHAGPVWRMCAATATRGANDGGDGDAARDAVLLSCGEDGAVRATPMHALRGLLHAPAAALGAGGGAGSGGGSWTVLQTAHPLRRLDASRQARGLVVAGDDAGRLHATRTVAWPAS